MGYKLDFQTKGETLMSAAEALPELLDIDQLARRLGTSHRHIRRLIAEQRIPYLKVGRLVRFDPEEINEWLDSTRKPAQINRGLRG